MATAAKPGSSNGDTSIRRSAISLTITNWMTSASIMVLKAMCAASK